MNVAVSTAFLGLQESTNSDSRAGERSGSLVLSTEVLLPVAVKGWETSKDWADGRRAAALQSARQNNSDRNTQEAST